MKFNKLQAINESDGDEKLREIWNAVASKTNGNRAFEVLPQDDGTFILDYYDSNVIPMDDLQDPCKTYNMKVTNTRANHRTLLWLTSAQQIKYIDFAHFKVDVALFIEQSDTNYLSLLRNTTIEHIGYLGIRVNNGGTIDAHFINELDDICKAKGIDSIGCHAAGYTNMSDIKSKPSSKIGIFVVGPSNTTIDRERLNDIVYDFSDKWDKNKLIDELIDIGLEEWI